VTDHPFITPEARDKYTSPPRLMDAVRPRLMHAVRMDWGTVLRFETRGEADDFLTSMDNPRVLRRDVVVDCEICDRDDFGDVPHYNCRHNGGAVGHSRAHCTNDFCF
jgi:hypothetical protein